MDGSKGAGRILKPIITENEKMEEEESTGIKMKKGKV